VINHSYQNYPRMRVVGISGLLLLLGAAYVNAATQCPQVTLASNFDPEKYAGVWYEMYSQTVSLQDGCSCSKYNWTLTSDSTFVDQFSCIKPSGASHITLNGKIPDLSNPANMNEAPAPISWVYGAPYQVLEVDQDYTYAVVYACVKLPLIDASEYVYIFLRDVNTLDSLDVQGIFSRLDAQGINYSKLNKISQDNCPASF
jgi:apolipoprotein D and lipocalin family protein